MLSALTLSGSIRKQSVNARLAQAMGAILADKGVTVTNINLADYPLDLFNADDERRDGEPAAAVELGELFGNSDMIFLASPEYNGSVSPLMKNTLDWISRQKQFSPFAKATFGLGAASPGKLGGIGGLRHLRDILSSVGALVVPSNIGVGDAGNVLTETGGISDPAVVERAEKMSEMMQSIRRSV